jgi:hypothetical protein
LSSNNNDYSEEIMSQDTSTHIQPPTATFTKKIGAAAPRTVSRLRIGNTSTTAHQRKN